MNRCAIRFLFVAAGGGGGVGGADPESIYIKFMFYFKNYVIETML
jgi:hypothetical protein